MTNFSINIQRTRPCLWYRTLGVIICMYANSDDLNMTTSHINQWGKSRYLFRSPCRMKTTAVVFISLRGVQVLQYVLWDHIAGAGYQSAIHKWCLRQWIYYHLRASQSWDPFNTLRNKQNGFRFAENIFKCTFLKENIYILIEISLKSTIYLALLVLKWKYYIRIGSRPWLLMLLVNTPRMMQKGSHFANSFFKFDFLIKIVIFWFKLHWNLFLADNNPVLAWIMAWY